MAREIPVAPFRTEELLTQRAWLHALAARLVRDHAERDDLVQETWLAALRHPLAGEARDLRQWLAAVLRNRWRFERRGRARRVAREQKRTGAEPSQAPAVLVEQAELQGLVVRAVLALEEPHRSTVLRRYFGGLSCRAIAREEGVPEGTVRSRLKRALDSLRVELDRSSGRDRRSWVLALVPLARLARAKHALPSSAVAAAAALALVWFAWSWSRGGDDVPRELAARAQDTKTHDVSAPRVGAPERTPLAPETSSLDAPRQLSAEGRLQLLVLAPDSRPIADAAVLCGAEDRRHALRTDEHGTCRIPDEAWASDLLELEVSAPGFVRHDAPIQRGSFSWSSPCPIYLPRAVPLEGRLRDADTGQPIENGELTLLFGYWSRPLARATTGEDGSFRLEPAPRGWEVELLVRAPGHAASQRLVQVSDTDRPHLELAMDRGIEFYGSILDAWTGAPVAGARAFHDANGFEGAPGDEAFELARSDARGEITLRVSPDAESRALLFFHPGYCSVRLNPRAEGFEVALLPAAAVEGTVQDGDGRAMAGSEVTLDGDARNPSRRALSLEAPPDSPLARLADDASLFVAVWRTYTDEHGRFRMEIVPGFGGSQLLVRGPEHADEISKLELPLAPGETRRWNVAVRSAGTIAGVLRVNGEPSPGGIQCFSGKRTVGSGWARPDGNFEICGVPPGPVSVQAFPEEFGRFGYVPGPGRLLPVLAEAEVVAGSSQRVELDLALTMGTIRGRVSSPGGLPRANAIIHASAGRNGGDWESLTDASGAFELRVPAELGPFELHVEGCPNTRAQVNTDGIELVSVRHGRIRVRAEDAASQAPLERVTLFVRRPGRAWESMGEFSAGTGGFAQWELEAGLLELAVNKIDDGYPSVLLGSFRLAEDGELELVATLERVAPTAFVLTNAPLPGACVLRLENSTGLPAESGGMLGRSGARVALRFQEGRVSVPSLASGEYRLGASSPDVVVEPALVRLGPDRSQPIDLTWHPRE